MKRRELSSMKTKAFGKKGSYTVFIAMFMSGMIIFSGAVINASHQRPEVFWAIMTGNSDRDTDSTDILVMKILQGKN